MTSQLNASIPIPTVRNVNNCRPPIDAPKDYCQKLKTGIARLAAAIQRQYEEVFPFGSDWISRALREAQEAAWSTPFPSLFFPALAHLRINEMMPSA